MCVFIYILQKQIDLDRLCLLKERLRQNLSSYCAVRNKDKDLREIFFEQINNICPEFNHLQLSYLYENKVSAIRASKYVDWCY